MPSFGSGFAHALTAGLTGYREGQDEQQKKLIVLAAQQRAEARQKQLDEIARIGALTNAANAGMEVTPVQPPSAPQPSGAAPAVVPDTGSVRAMKGQNPTSPEGGAANPAPATPSQDGTVLGTVGGMQIRVPQGGVLGKAARDDAAKQAQRTADLLRRAQPLNSRLPDGHPFKLTDDQLAGVTADPQLYNEWAKGALGIAKDPLALHKAMRDYDRANPLRDAASSEPSWQILQTDEGTYERNPKTGQTRAVLDPSGKQIMPRAARGVLKQVAENTEQLQAIDNAIQQVQANPNAIGMKRAILPDIISQRTDPQGVDTRAAIANVGSMIIHDRSGAAVTVSESKRLNPFVPTDHDTPDAAVRKLKQLRSLLATETAALGGSVAQAGAQPAASPAPTTAPHVQTIDEMIRAGKSDAEIKAAIQRGVH